MNVRSAKPPATELARLLADHNRERFSPALPGARWRDDLARAHDTSALEIAWVEDLRARVAARAEEAPRSGDAFVAWFERLREHGPGQHDPLFPFLAEVATREQVRWFIAQEVAGEAGFEDLLALTQRGFGTRAKLEMARNFWDEMGRGNPEGMHGPMLARTARELEVVGVPTITAALDLANLMTALAHHRRYAFHAVGALGVIELTAPTRTASVQRALERTGVSREAQRYFAVHSTVDVKHSRAWNAEVLAPLVEERPDVAPAIAEGALLRLEAGARCFEAYRAYFQAPAAS